MKLSPSIHRLGSWGPGRWQLAQGDRAISHGDVEWNQDMCTELPESRGRARTIAPAGLLPAALGLPDSASQDPRRPWAVVIEAVCPAPTVAFWRTHGFWA